MTQAMRQMWLFGIIFVILFGAVWFSAAQIPAAWELSDFHVTFYRAARYFLHGENVYLSAYPHPFNGREYPPYAPIWALYAFVPFAALSLPYAEGLRVALDVVAMPLLAYLTARWVGARQARVGILLILAPWLLLEVQTGQLTPFVFLGTLLCYWGVRKPSAPMTAVGLWLALAKFNLAALVLLATVYFAWRQKILWRTLAILAFLVAIFSLASPLWFVDVVRMYGERLATPRLADSVLLLPFYPWGQLALLAMGALFLIGYVQRFQLTQPTRWLWAVLAGTSLVGALHTFPYDWQLLMLPLAWLSRWRWGVVLALIAYAYPVLWAVGVLGLNLVFPSVAVVPGFVLLAVLGVGMLKAKQVYAEAT